MMLLDTNVISELRKIPLTRADANVERWVKTTQASDLFISVITVEELEIGVRRAARQHAQQGVVFQRWLHHYVLPAFHGRILSVDTAIALRSASLHVPNPRPIRDALIAATALVHQMQVVTRNVSDFASLGAPVFNPWD
jgi:toxin FitB